MNRHSILVAEDDPNIREGLVDALESEGYHVDAAPDGKQALNLFKQGDYRLALLDVMMPEIDGYALCQELRKLDASMGIILVTAKGQEFDKVLGLKLGADDYVTKPFGVNELLARVEATLRRTGSNGNGSNAPELPDQMAFGSLQLDRAKYRLSGERHSVDLTAREMKLLELFAQNSDKVLTRNQLLDEAWGVSYYGTTRTLDQHIAQLRKKIKQLDGGELIETVHGVGYRFGG